MARFGLFGNLFGSNPKDFMGDLVGRNVTIEGKRVIIDGKVVTDKAEGVIELKIMDGVVENITSSASVTVQGNVTGNVEADMSVTCGDVGGRVEAQMSVDCGNIAGDARSGMSITARDITGKASAGMTVNARTVGAK